MLKLLNPPKMVMDLALLKPTKHLQISIDIEELQDAKSKLTPSQLAEQLGFELLLIMNN